MEKSLKRQPQRMCVACRGMKDKDSLIRVVRNEDKSFSIDLSGKKPGRGAYICSDEACIKKATKARSFAKAFRMAIPPELLQSLQEEIARGGK